MKIVIVCAFDTYFERVRLLKKYYEEKGNEVLILSSSFSHRKKEQIQSDLVDISISTKPYYKNLSIDRLYNHYEFSSKTKEQLETIQPDFIHCLIPCNSLCKTMSEYKEKHNVKLIFDVMDLWPETMPIQTLKNHFPFTLWKNIRDQYLKNADYILCECDLFKEKLNLIHYESCSTLYWSKENLPLDSHPELSDDLEFCYLGSINHIIDIPFIVQFLKECSLYKKVRLHIIGNGENKTDWIYACLENGINVIDHKEIYDPEKKQKIFDQCHYALNVMKPSVVVGLTMKSLDYLCGSIPMINTIQGDTYTLCEEKDLGWNVDTLNYKKAAYLLCEESKECQLQRRRNCKEAYYTYFTYESFKMKLDEVYGKILHNG